MSFISKLKSKFQSVIKSDKFSYIEKELYNGKFNRANELLDEMDKSNLNFDEDIIKYNILKGYALSNSGSPAKGLELLDEIIEKYSNIENKSLLSEVYVAKAYFLFDLNKLPESSEFLEKGTQLFSENNVLTKKESDELFGKIHYLKGRILRKKNDIPNSLEELSKSLEFRKNSDNHDGLGDIYAELGILYFMTQNPDKSIESLLKGIEIFKQINSKTKLLKAYNNIGLIYSNLQQQDKTIEYYLLSSKLLEEFGDQFKPQLGVNMINIGKYYREKGEIDKALNYLERAIQIFDELGIKDTKAYALQHKAIIYELKGDIQISLDMYKEILKIFDELHNEQEIGITNNNIGSGYVTKGELTQAISYFEKGLESAKKLGDPTLITIGLYNLIESYAGQNNIDKASSYLDEMLQLNKGDNKSVDQLCKLSQARLLKNSKRIIKRAQAQLIYQQIAYDEMFDFQNSVEALFNLCEMLIQELRSSGNESIILEVKDAISKLIKIATDQNSFKILVQSKLLQSKVALLELDLNTAKAAMGEAQQIAFEKGLDNLAMVISGEYDALINQLAKWTDLIDSNVSMIERLEMAELEGLVSNMVRKKADSAEMLSEVPELFLVLNDQGMKIFSKVFTSESNLDDQVVGDLLTAVNAFIQETFSASGSIERLKHKEHTLMLKPLDKYLTCYVFKGQSYTALQKLEKFIEKVKEEESIYQTVISSTEEIHDETFNSLVTTIFTAKASATES